MKYAVLDETNVLTSIVDDEPAGGKFIPVPDGCDLEPNFAEWDDDKQTFHVRPQGVVPRPEALTDDLAYRRIAEFILAVANGDPVPLASQRWAQAYIESFDARSLGGEIPALPTGRTGQVRG